jgi:hypothetical protein
LSLTLFQPPRLGVAALPEVAVAVPLPEELLLATAAVTGVLALGFHVPLAAVAVAALEDIQRLAVMVPCLAPQHRQLVVAAVAAAEGLTK